ncbi:MAG: DUF7309 domain-containing protein [Anaerovoracaceae bacterium]
MGNKKPTIMQWGKLYNLALEIKKKEPWNYLWDIDLVAVKLPGRDEPVYVSTMGRNGACFGIGVYPDNKAYYAFDEMAAASDEDRISNPMSYQNCIMCYYGERDELSPEESFL